MSKKFLSIFLVVIVLLPHLVLAQEWFSKWKNIFESIANKFRIPEDYMRFPKVIYFVFIPFVGTFTIIYALLTKIRIFEENKFNATIAFLFTFSLLYFGYLLALMEYIYSLSSFTIVVLFSLLLIFAVLMWSLRTYRRIREGGE